MKMLEAESKYWFFSTLPSVGCLQSDKFKPPSHFVKSVWNPFVANFSSDIMHINTLPVSYLNSFNIHIP